MGRASGPGPRMAAGRGAAGGAGRGRAHRCGPACAVRSGKAGRGRRDGTEGDAGGPAARASIGLTARISRPPRACPSAPCATVSPEGAGTASRLNSEQDLALAIEPALPRRGGGRPPPPVQEVGKSWLAPQSPADHVWHSFSSLHQAPPPPPPPRRRPSGRLELAVCLQSL